MADEQSPIKIKKIGHVVYTVSDLERTSKFWTEIMGFKFSDRNEAGMVFFRNSTDHHTVALMQAKENTPLPKRGQVGFDHFALEVATVSELFKIRDFLKAKGVTITYASMDQIGNDGKSRPASEWRRATTLEEAVANPLPGAEYR
jgi:catechol 2,3-dioxygenase-like lactoylglutathione lyase family enzyme